VSYVSSNSGDTHAFVPFFHFVNMLREKPTLLILKIPYVNFDQQVNVACIRNF